ncbi:TfoX/Sxy family DNA transformation protein [Endozoicomonas sp. SM1973]|uniref:TfoX/Sxy family DNA transformation protein n=1 Tax=Spartinivicinus marinus TaxID=2994442 RepID=A0A853I3X8_9GAMM|nr:TfoX/Sxy family DNA transformation protein [Spartinivicinus marinus]MCX4030084.1 TfoX/Sxy family DNA transformation protein [Spartinivicinus marinus]NYZ64671.1 TfoX/Sxy family DNA transformation protein [Spartinivicinus marinus]
MKQSELTQFRNIGKTVAKRLASINIKTFDDLAKVGSATAYQMLSADTGQRLPVCYYLYSLEGALQDRHWDDFSEEEKYQLRVAAGVVS